MTYIQKRVANVQRLASMLTFLAVIGTIAASCSNQRPVYQGAEYYKNLEVPPDLTEPDKADEVRIPKPTDQAMQRFRDNNQLDTVITPRFDGVRVVSNAGTSWIEIDNNVDKVWPKLLEFWEYEGFELVQIRPQLGFMETGWENRLTGDKGFLASIMQKIEPDQKDKFRVRVESFDNDTKTRVFVTNSRIERKTSGEYGDTFSWQSLPSSVAAEREIISRMAIFAGLSNSDTETLVANYRPYTSLVKVDSTNTAALTMKGSMDFVWSRAVRALDRMRMQDIVEHKADNSINFVAGELSSDELNIQEDELTKTSWIMQLFTGHSDEPANSKNRQYRLVFSNQGESIRIVVKDARNSQTTDDDGDTQNTALAEQLRNMLVEYLE